MTVLPGALLYVAGAPVQAAYVGEEQVYRQKAETFTDTFDDEDSWTVGITEGTSSATFDGRLTLSDESQTWPFVQTKRAFDLTDSSITIELVDMGDINVFAYRDSFIALGNDVGLGSLQFDFERQDADEVLNLYAQNPDDAADYRRLASFPVDHTAMRWLRFRHSAGVVHWEVSPDRTTWTTLHSMVPDFPITQIHIGIGTGSDTRVSTVWDNLNLYG